VRHCVLAMVGEAGHMVPLEQPGVVWRLLRAFLHWTADSAEMSPERWEEARWGLVVGSRVQSGGDGHLTMTCP
jgi:hypothetical protein